MDCSPWGMGIGIKTGVGSPHTLDVPPCSSRVPLGTFGIVGLFDPESRDSRSGVRVRPGHPHTPHPRPTSLLLPHDSRSSPGRSLGRSRRWSIRVPSLWERVYSVGVWGPDRLGEDGDSDGPEFRGPFRETGGLGVKGRDI